MLVCWAGHSLFVARGGIEYYRIAPIGAIFNSAGLEKLIGGII